MSRYLVKYDFSKFQPRWFAGDKAVLFGEYNEGFEIQGATPDEAFDAWNDRQPPGRRLNKFYLSITEVTRVQP